MRNALGSEEIKKPMANKQPKPRKKFKSQTRSVKTKATHPDPVVPDKRKGGIGKKPMDFTKREKTCEGSWWTAGCHPGERETFIELAHKRDEEMRDDATWNRRDNLKQLQES